MKIVEITEKKMSELSEGLEEMLTIGGRLMSCIEQLEEEGEEPEMGFRRGRMGRRGGYGMRSPMSYRGSGGYRSNDVPERNGGQYNDPYYN